jgi:DNA polymerase (family X)
MSWHEELPTMPANLKRVRSPLRNSEIADQLDDIATMLELAGANQFRVRAYRNASRLLRRYGREVSDMLAGGEKLAELPGVGKDLAGKIQNLTETGSTELLEQLKASTPPVALELMQVPGLGPKRIATLVKKLRLRSMQELQRAAAEGRISKIRGFGEKIQQELLQKLQRRSLKTTRVLLATAAAAAKPLLAYLEKQRAISRVVIAGSYRRGQETVGDLDILCTAPHGEEAISAFTAYPEFSRIEAAGATRATAFLRSGLQVDLRVVNPECLGAALHYFTGSKAHNIAVRAIARKHGIKINEYGIYRGHRRLAGETEEQVFAAIGLPYIEPELRENRGEIEAARDGHLPGLVALQDLRGDLHVHSNHTDGTLTIREMAEAAKARGLSYIAMADHSRHLAMTHGLGPAELRREMAEIDRINAAHPGIHVLKAIELDILPDGKLDLPDSLLEKLDIVVAAVHSSFHLGRELQTARIEKALAHPLVTILAHPTGRLLGTRDGYDVDMERVIRAAALHQVVLEINAQPDRLDLPDIYARMAKDAGALVSINSDAHAAEDFDNLRYGTLQARRGWIEEKDVLNTLSFPRLMAALAERRQRKTAPAAAA